MTRLSRHKLTPTIKQRLVDDFFDILSDLNGNEQKNFLNNLFTPTEMETFAKRLAILKGLRSDKTYWEIKDEVKVTGSTIAKMHNILSRAGEKFLVTLDHLIDEDKLLNDLKKDI